MEELNNTANSGVGQGEDIDQEGDKPKEGEEEELLNLEFDMVLNSNDLNDCATLYQSILNLKESASEDEMRAATDNFQARLADIISKYHRLSQPSGEIPQQMSRLLGKKELLFMSNERILDFLPQDSQVTQILREILTTDKFYFGDFYELFGKLVAQQQSIVKELEGEIESLQNRIRDAENVQAQSISSASSSSASPLSSSSPSSNEPDPEKELLKQKLAEYERLCGVEVKDISTPSKVGGGIGTGVVLNDPSSASTITQAPPVSIPEISPSEESSLTKATITASHSAPTSTVTTTTTTTGTKYAGKRTAASPKIATTTTPHYMTPKSGKRVGSGVSASISSISTTKTSGTPTPTSAINTSSSFSPPVSSLLLSSSTRLRKATICVPTEELNITSNKYITLHQLEEIIEEIYKGKVKHDSIMRENRLPKETLAQYLFTHFVKKVGLRNLVEDNLNALLYYTQKYIPTSNDVAVFAALVNNEIDDEFRLVQKQLKETLEQLIHAFLRGKYQHETEKQIYERKQQRLHGGRVAEDEWMSAIKFMYNDKDVERLTPLILGAIEKEKQSLEEKCNELFSQQKVSRSDKKGIPTPQIAYPDLLKIILDFHLANHKVYLQPFNTFFSSAQNEGGGISPGVLNEEGFRSLYNQIHNQLEGSGRKKKEKDAKLERLLNQVDPFSNQVIIYGDCVRAFADDIEQYNREIAEKEEEI